METVGWILSGLGIYGLIGAIFAAWFVTAGVGGISPGARGSGVGFRLLIFPGSAALWPVLAWEVIASRTDGGLILGLAAKPSELETEAVAVDIDDSILNRKPEVDPDAETSA